MDESGTSSSNRPRVDHTYHDFSQYLQRGGEIIRHKKFGANFPAKLQQMLSNPQYANIITWMPHGRAWKILDKKLLMKEAVPKYFVQRKFESFTRQLSGWGFKRLHQSSPDFGCYYNECFLRGIPQLTSLMVRAPTNQGKGLPNAEGEPNFYLISEAFPLPRYPVTVLVKEDWSSTRTAGRLVEEASAVSSAAWQAMPIVPSLAAQIHPSTSTVAAATWPSASMPPVSTQAAQLLPSTFKVASATSLSTQMPIVETLAAQVPPSTFTLAAATSSPAPIPIVPTQAAQLPSAFTVAAVSSPSAQMFIVPTLAAQVPPPTFAATSSSAPMSWNTSCPETASLWNSGFPTMPSYQDSFPAASSAAASPMVPLSSSMPCMPSYTAKTRTSQTHQSSHDSFTSYLASSKPTDMTSQANDNSSTSFERKKFAQNLVMPSNFPTSGLAVVAPQLHPINSFPITSHQGTGMNTRTYTVQNPTLQLDQKSSTISSTSTATASTPISAANSDQAIGYPNSLTSSGMMSINSGYHSHNGPSTQEVNHTQLQHPSSSYTLQRQHDLMSRMADITEQSIRNSSRIGQEQGDELDHSQRRSTNKRGDHDTTSFDDDMGAFIDDFVG